MNPFLVCLYIKLYVGIHLYFNSTATVWHVEAGILHNQGIFPCLYYTNNLILDIPLQSLDGYQALSVIIGGILFSVDIDTIYSTFD